jgi:Cu/Ag efflux pump CusA
MNLAGIPAKLLSLGATDFGIIVEGVIVMTEARPAAARGEA